MRPVTRVPVERFRSIQRDVFQVGLKHPVIHDDRRRDHLHPRSASSSSNVISWPSCLTAASACRKPHCLSSASLRLQSRPQSATTNTYVIGWCWLPTQRVLAERVHSDEIRVRVRVLAAGQSGCRCSR
uniref:(northern house mosquito) hypothetical protein n=1 Tax=Culex pipiens TaxID=7175 RepID=A0A8D8ABY6_CULPI